MNLILNENEIIKIDLSPLYRSINPSYIERFSKSTGEHYKLLKYISWKYKNSLFLDIGTREGASAICLADNPSNKVISIDITDKYREENKFDFSSYSNIVFQINKIQNENSTFFEKFDLILLDIDHTGKYENIILRKLEKKFKGILIMDDINFPRFRRLNEVWNDIKRKKIVINCAHHSGTGIVSFGPEVKYNKGENKCL